MKEQEHIARCLLGDGLKFKVCFPVASSNKNLILDDTMKEKVIDHFRECKDVEKAEELVSAMSKTFDPKQLKDFESVLNGEAELTASLGSLDIGDLIKKMVGKVYQPGFNFKHYMIPKPVGKPCIKLNLQGKQYTLTREGHSWRGRNPLGHVDVPENHVVVSFKDGVTKAHAMFHFAKVGADRTSFDKLLVFSVFNDMPMPEGGYFRNEGEAVNFFTQLMGKKVTVDDLAGIDYE